MAEEWGLSFGFGSVISCTRRQRIFFVNKKSINQDEIARNQSVRMQEIYIMR